MIVIGHCHFAIDRKPLCYGTQETKEIPFPREFQVAEQPTQDKPSAYTSVSRGTRPFLVQNSAPYALSADSSYIQDAQKTRRKPSAHYCPRLFRLPPFIEMVLVMVIIQAGSPVLVAGEPNTEHAEEITLQAGQSATIPSDIPLVHNNAYHFVPHASIWFESNPNPFFYDGFYDVRGFKFPSQITRFEVSGYEMPLSFIVSIHINPVDMVDEDVYVLEAVLFQGYTHKTVMKKIQVHVSPGPAKCSLAVSKNNKYLYEVNCQAAAGSTETTLTCYQYGKMVEGESDIIETDEGHITRGVFLLHDHTPFSCCSHDVPSAVNVTTCNDFKWPPNNGSNIPPPRSHVFSGTCKQFEVSSVSLTIGVIINLLFVLYIEFVNAWPNQRETCYFTRHVAT